MAGDSLAHSLMNDHETLHRTKGVMENLYTKSATECSFWIMRRARRGRNASPPAILRSSHEWQWKTPPCLWYKVLLVECFFWITRRARRSLSFRIMEEHLPRIVSPQKNFMSKAKLRISPTTHYFMLINNILRKNSWSFGWHKNNIS